MRISPDLQLRGRAFSFLLNGAELQAEKSPQVEGSTQHLFSIACCCLEHSQKISSENAFHRIWTVAATKQFAGEHRE